MPVQISVAVAITAGSVGLAACPLSYFQPELVAVRNICRVSVGLAAIASSVFIPPLLVHILPATVLRVGHFGIGQFILGTSIHSNFVAAVAHGVSDRVIEPLVYSFFGGQDAVLASNVFVGNLTVREVHRPLVRGGMGAVSSFLIEPGNNVRAGESAINSFLKYLFKSNGDLFGICESMQLHRIAAGAFYPLAKGWKDGKSSCEITWAAIIKACKEIHISTFPLPSDPEYGASTFIGADWFTYVLGDAIENLGAAICPTVGGGAAISIAGAILSIVVANAVPSNTSIELVH